jgi:hypothetical protein
MAEIGTLETAVSSLQVETDINTLIHIQSSHHPRSSYTTCHTPVLISVAVILALCILYLPLHPCLSKAYMSCKLEESQEATYPGPSEPDHSNPPQATPRTELASPAEEPTCQVHFARYAVPAM